MFSLCIWVDAGMMGDVNMLKLLRSFVYFWASAAFLSWTQSPRIEMVPSKSWLCHKLTKNNKPRL